MHFNITPSIHPGSYFSSVQFLCIIHLLYRHARGSRQHRLILARDKRTLCDKVKSCEVSFSPQTSSTCGYVCLCLWLSTVFLSTFYHISEPLLCGLLLSLPHFFHYCSPFYLNFSLHFNFPCGFEEYFSSSMLIRASMYWCIGLSLQ